MLGWRRRKRVGEGEERKAKELREKTKTKHVPVNTSTIAHEETTGNFCKSVVLSLDGAA